MAPDWVQTYALTFTAISCASGMLAPPRSLAIKVAVKLSPAPTVSATSTLGVGMKLNVSKVITYERICDTECRGDNPSEECYGLLTARCAACCVRRFCCGVMSAFL